jgi:hypothetical protein
MCLWISGIATCKGYEIDPASQSRAGSCGSVHTGR